jgi:hypothetical protein
MFRLVLRAPRTAASALALALSLAAPIAPALANHGHGVGDSYIDTVYVAPTAYAVPTAYTAAAYVPSSFVDVLYPTVYSSPYVATSYVLEPTAYVPTRYTRARAYRSAWRPYYATTSWAYTPTSWSYWPTSYDVPVVATSASYAYGDPCCAGSTTVIARPSAPAASGGTVPPLNSNAGTNAAGTSGEGAQPPNSLNSTPQAGGQGAPARSAEEMGVGQGEQGLDFPTGPLDDNGGALNPPASPPDAGAQPNTGTGSGIDNYGPQASRSAYRPVPTDLRASASMSPVGAMRGVVLAAAPGTGAEAPRPNAKVVFQDLKQTYTDTTADTDAEGRFEVLLPNGDWRVNIEGADGKLTPYGNLRVVNGRFFDERNRAVTSLRLHE